MALPDGRVQTVRYTADHYGGYVAEVTYEGTAVYPDAPAPYHAPAPVHHAPVHHPAPVYRYSDEFGKTFHTLEKNEGQTLIFLQTRWSPPSRLREGHCRGSRPSCRQGRACPPPGLQVHHQEGRQRLEPDHT